MVTVTNEWKNLYKGAAVGVMAVSQLANPAYSKELESKKMQLIQLLKRQFKTKEELLAYEPVQAYIAYYKHYKKTYHVLQQMESVLFKGKDIPSVIPLVEAMFMAELKNGLLTAGHDRDTLKLPLTVGAANGGETYISIGGKEQAVKPKDMFIYDGVGIIFSVLGGPDVRTKITERTKNSIFVVYAPPGIDADRIQEHLNAIFQNIRVFAPKAEFDFCNIYTA